MYKEPTITYGSIVLRKGNSKFIFAVGETKVNFIEFWLDESSQRWVSSDSGEITRITAINDRIPTLFSAGYNLE